MGKLNHNRLLIIFLVTTMILSSVGNALAAEEDSHGSSLNIKAQLNRYIENLDPVAQEPVQWIVDNFFLIVVVAMVLLVWYHGAEEASAKRSNSTSGQANAQKSQEHVAKKFLWSIVLSIMILFFAAKYLL